MNVTLGEPSAFPQFGTSARFSGESSYVDLANNISTWLNRTASLEFWIKTTQSGTGSWNAPAVAGTDSNGDGDDLFWGINSEGGKVGVRRGDSGGGAALTLTPINDDTWHHLVLTREHSTGLLLTYLDGNPNPVGMFDDIDNFDDIDRPYDRLGALNFVPGPAQQLEAALDEIAIYDYVLSGTQVEAHYLAAIPEPSTFILAACALLGFVGDAWRRRRLATRCGGLTFANDAL